MNIRITPMTIHQKSYMMRIILHLIHPWWSLPVTRGYSITKVIAGIFKPRNLSAQVMGWCEQYWTNFCDRRASKQCIEECYDRGIRSLKEKQYLDSRWTPTRKKWVGCKWVFKLKKHADGSISRCKARLVAQGFSQEAGLWGLAILRLSVQKLSQAQLEWFLF